VTEQFIDNPAASPCVHQCTTKAWRCHCYCLTTCSSHASAFSRVENRCSYSWSRQTWRSEVSEVLTSSPHVVKMVLLLAVTSTIRGKNGEQAKVILRTQEHSNESEKIQMLRTAGQMSLLWACLQTPYTLCKETLPENYESIQI